MRKKIGGIVYDIRGKHTVDPTLHEVRKLAKLTQHFLKDVESGLRKGNDVGALLNLRRALSQFQQYKDMVALGNLGTSIEKSLNEVFDQIEKVAINETDIIDAIQNKRALILAKTFGKSGLSNNNSDEFNIALRTLCINSEEMQLVYEKAINIANDLEEGRSLEFLIPESYKSLLSENLKLDPEKEFNKYNGKSIDTWVEELKKQFTTVSVPVVSRNQFETQQNISTTSSLIATNVDIAENTTGKPKKVLPNAVKEIETILSTNPDDLRLFLQGVNNVPLTEYWELANLDIETERLEVLLPVLTLVESILVSKEKRSEESNLTKALDGFNGELNGNYEQITRGELNDLIDKLNQFVNKNYDVNSFNGQFVTDVTSGLWNEVDSLILDAYKEKIQFSNTSYDSFIKDVLGVSTLKRNGIEEKELKRRLELKLGLDVNDYHIIRAFRELNGHKEAIVSINDLRTQLLQKHKEFKSEEIDLDKRFEIIQKDFPNLLGLKEVEKPQSVNGEAGLKITEVKYPLLDQLLDELGFKPGEIPDKDSFSVQYAHNRSRLLGDKYKDLRRAYHGFMDNKISIDLVFEDKTTKHEVVTKEQLRTYCAQTNK